MKGRGAQFWVNARHNTCAISFHAGGAQFLFADGHARFISETIDAQMYKYLGGRADGRLVADF
jgi:prepilin-type processing-associated H-X9-DG protein